MPPQYPREAAQDPPERVTNFPGIYLTNRIAGGYAVAWTHGTFVASVGRHRRNCVLRAIQRVPERVRAYFTPEPVRYAA